MRFLKILLGSVVWLVAELLGLVGLLLSVTVILLPLGIPVLMLAKRLFTVAMALIVPRAARHPVEAISKSGRKSFGKGKKNIGKFAHRQRKRLPV